jgi:hypothetical protein
VRLSAYSSKWPCAQHQAIHQSTRTVARRDIDLAPILAALAPFLLEESAFALRRRMQDDAPATDREHKRLDLCRIRRIGDSDLSSSAMEPILCSAPLGGQSWRAILSLSHSYATGTRLVKPAGPGRTAIILRVYHRRRRILNLGPHLCARFAAGVLEH